MAQLNLPTKLTARCDWYPVCAGCLLYLRSTYIKLYMDVYLYVEFLFFICKCIIGLEKYILKILILCCFLFYIMSFSYKWVEIHEIMSYGKCSKILNAFPFLFSNQGWLLGLEITKCLSE